MSWRSSLAFVLLSVSLSVHAAGGQFTAADGVTLHYTTLGNTALFADMQKSWDLREPLAALPHARLLWIDESGHFPWIEQPAAFRRALTTALHV